VRLESIDQTVAEVYRKRYETMIGRADLYVGYFERALDMLAPGGVYAFICADRWMLNQYGSRLRTLITSGGFSVEAVVEMHRANAFQDEVLAYPAITAIRRADKQGKVLVARVGRNSGSIGTLPEAGLRIRSQEDPDSASLVAPRATHVVVDEWFAGSDPWPCVSPDRLKLLKRLEAEFPPLEDPHTGTKVGIGVATGADKVFLTKDPKLVEESRLLPLALAKDTMNGVLAWSGHYLVNPWEADGTAFASAIKERAKALAALREEL
jgi:adenine-specific DNA-methyltransferase